MTVIDMNESPNTTASGVVEELKASGALDELFARIDSGDIELTGDGGLMPMPIKETLERGLQPEMTTHLGYGTGDRDAKTTGAYQLCARTEVEPGSGLAEHLKGVGRADAHSQASVRDQHPGSSVGLRAFVGDHRVLVLASVGDKEIVGIGAGEFG